MTKWLAILILICVSLTMAFFACEEEEDDDDENDDNDDDDDNDSAGDDDDNLGSGMDQCVSLEMKCFGFDESAALLVCEEYYNLEQACSQGATDTFLDCVDDDCNSWEDCATAWEDAINC